MECNGDFPDPLHGDIRWQVAIDSQEPGAQRALRGAVEVDHLAAGVYARISAPGCGGADRLVGDHANSGIQNLLDTTRMTLSLPPKECAAVVLESGSEALNCQALGGQPSDFALGPVAGSGQSVRSSSRRRAS
jgi:hypothetical protein